MTEENCLYVPDTECIDITKNINETKYEEECHTVYDKKCTKREEKSCYQQYDQVLIIESGAYLRTFL